MAGRAHKETRATKQASGGTAPRVMSNDPPQPEAGPSNRKMRGNESPHEVNDPLATVDADDRPRGALPPHESAGQSSECVIASAPRLRRQVDDVSPQECEELRTQHVEEYFDVANIDHYDVILGMPFLRQLQITLDFTGQGIIHIGMYVVPMNMPSESSDDMQRTVTSKPPKPRPKPPE